MTPNDQEQWVNMDDVLPIMLKNTRAACNVLAKGKAARNDGVVAETG